MPRSTTTSDSSTSRIPGAPDQDQADLDATAATAAATGDLSMLPTTIANRMAESSARFEEEQSKTTAPLKGSPQELLAAEKAKVAELRRQHEELIALSGNLLKQLNAKTEQPEPIKPLPTVEEAKADVEKRVAAGASVHAVMTKDGHYVHPLAGYQAPQGQAMDQKSIVAMVGATVEAMRSASVADALRPKPKVDMMEAGRPPAFADA